jgi:hypothetical protein
MPQISKLVGKDNEIVKRDDSIVVHIEDAVHGSHLLSPEIAGVGIFLKIEFDVVFRKSISYEGFLTKLNPCTDPFQSN